jgi:hypothetical protein
MDTKFNRKIPNKDKIHKINKNKKEENCHHHNSSTESWGARRGVGTGGSK